MAGKSWQPNHKDFGGFLTELLAFEMNIFLIQEQDDLVNRVTAL